MNLEASPPIRALQMTIDGEAIDFNEGETIYEVATRRSDTEIPTLCYDERLEAFGGCRLCVVEVEGMRAPVASCTTKATAGMKVTTRTEKIEKYRKTLLEMVASENRNVDVDPLHGYASQELAALVERYEARTGRFGGKRSGTSNTNDKNPFILRDYENCISCYRCVRVCAEQEGDHAINVMNRGFQTQIITEFNGDLKDSQCTFCGQCVQDMPHGSAWGCQGIAGGGHGRGDREDQDDLSLLRGGLLGRHHDSPGQDHRGASCHGRSRQQGPRFASRGSLPSISCSTKTG